MFLENEWNLTSGSRLLIDKDYIWEQKTTGDKSEDDKQSFLHKSECDFWAVKMVDLISAWMCHKIHLDRIHITVDKQVHGHT